ncbi:DUF2642 domain-containing protein [Priestia aryabhattai]|uniref:DUF2642 domain-containing protein n=1 Tax=Priestia aryabhattai TaxID=412384 RepID=UPI00356205B2
MALGNAANFTINLGNANLPFAGSKHCNCTHKDDFRTYLLTLKGKCVRITTSSEEFSGILLAIKSDYIVLSENQGSLIFIPISKIRTVAEI